MQKEDVILGSNVIPVLMLSKAQISGTLAATQKLTYGFIVHSALCLELVSMNFQAKKMF